MKKKGLHFSALAQALGTKKRHSIPTIDGKFGGRNVFPRPPPRARRERPPASPALSHLVPTRRDGLPPRRGLAVPPPARELGVGPVPQPPDLATFSPSAPLRVNSSYFPPALFFFWSFSLELLELLQSARQREMPGKCIEALEINKISAASGTYRHGGAPPARSWREEKKRPDRARNKNSQFKPAPHRHGGAPQLASGPKEKKATSSS